MRTVSLKLPDDLEARLERAALTRGRSKSDVVRRALARYLPGEERRDDRSSFLSLAAGLVGCVDGPPDLSENPRHLDGYGE